MESPTDELAGLRRLAAALRSKSLAIYENKQDVTAREVWKLENSIKHLESVLKRMKSALEGSRV
jgi:hypothetical protein